MIPGQELKRVKMPRGNLFCRSDFDFATLSGSCRAEKRLSSLVYFFNSKCGGSFCIYVLNRSPVSPCLCVDIWNSFYSQQHSSFTSIGCISCCRSLYSFTNGLICAPVPNDAENGKAASKLWKKLCQFISIFWKLGLIFIFYVSQKNLVFERVR